MNVDYTKLKIVEERNEFDQTNKEKEDEREEIFELA
jgi:hypothetical protein